MKNNQYYRCVYIGPCIYAERYILKTIIIFLSIASRYNISKQYKGTFADSQSAVENSEGLYFIHKYSYICHIHKGKAQSNLRSIFRIASGNNSTHKCAL